MITKGLTIGTVYEIIHKRKGKFIALLTDIEPAPEGDEADDFFLKVRFDVRLGTDQYWMAANPKQRYRESNLRPSLILKMVELEGDHWLREVKVQVTPEPEPGLGILQKVGKFLEGKKN